MKISKILASIFFVAVSLQVTAADVAPDGSFTHQIPIEIPPGTAGMQPSISLVYNSNNPNGVVGVGWQLAGIPVISRDTSYGLTYTNSDHFIGQGGRMIGIGGGVYHYENENFSKLEQVANCGAGPCGWIETLKNGVKYYYGSSSNSRYSPSNRNANYQWALDKVEDLHGNSYIVEYTNVGDGQLYPEKIIYTLGNGLLTFRRIKFIYEDRTDTSINYSFYTKVITTKRLAKITTETKVKCYAFGTFCTGDPVREYRLSYDYGIATGRSHLTSIDRYGNQNSNKGNTRTIFYWKNTNPAHTGLEEISFNIDYLTRRYWDYPEFLPYPYGTYYMSGDYIDINGDGLTDFSQSYNETSGLPAVQTYLNEIDGLYFDSQYTLQVPKRKYWNDDSGNFYNTGEYIDINGDGLVDFLRTYEQVDSYLIKQVFINNGHGFEDRTSEYYIPMTHRQYWNNDSGNYYETGDFIDINGDGLVDFIESFKTDTGVPYTNAYINNGNGFFLDSGYVVPFQKRKYWNDRSGNFYNTGEYIEINGDGLVDFLRTYEDVGSALTKQVFINNGHGFEDKTSEYYIPFTHRQYWNNDSGNYYETGDFIDVNGDGLVDFIESFKTDTGVSYTNAYINTGNGFSLDSGYVVPFQKRKYWNNASGSFYDTGEYVDINGDGLVDFFRTYEDIGSGLTKQVFINNGHGFEDKTSEYNIPLTQRRYWNNGTGVYYQTGDFVDINADGFVDYIESYRTTNNFRSNHVYKNTIAKELIVGILEPLGANVSVAYDTLPNMPQTVKPMYNTYPVIANNAPFFVVTQLRVDSGNDSNKDRLNDLYSTSYEYHNGKLYIGDKLNRRNLGFEWIKKINDQTGAYTKTIFNQGADNLLFAGAPKIIESYGDGGILLQRTENNFEAIYKISFPFSGITGATWGGTHLVRPAAYPQFASKTSYYDTNGGNAPIKEKKSYIKYDAPSSNFIYTGSDFYRAGSVTEQWDEVSGDTNVVKKKIQYSYDTTNNILNRVIAESVWVGTTRLKELQYTYLGNNVVSTREWLDTQGDYISTSYGYDSFGNITSITNALSNTTYTKYEDVYHTFPEKLTMPGTTNAAHTIYKTYDSKTGKVSNETDENGKIIKNTYDEFGRLIQVKSANTTIQEIFYHDDLIGQPSAQYTEVSIADNSVDGYQWQKTYFDGLGREYRTESEGYTSAGISYCIVKEKKFDLAGRVWKESNPYPVAGSKDGCTGSPTDFTEYQYDVAGRVEKVIYPESSAVNPVISNITYPGNTVTVSGPGPSWQTTTYDNRGRTIRVDEPENSSIQYGYDALGRLTNVSQKNTSGTYIDVSSITYDSFDRKISMTEIDTGSWSYAYDDLGNLNIQTDPKGQKTDFDYDHLNRLTKKSYLSATGMPMDTTVEYVYDTAAPYGIGRIATITDETGLTSLNYDIQGNVTTAIRTLHDVNNPIPTNDFSLKFEYTYDIQNRLKEMIYPDGDKIRNYYSDNGSLSSVWLSKLTAAGTYGWGAPVVTYKGPENINTATNTGEIRRETGNGVVTKIGFDTKTFRPTSLQTNLPDAGGVAGAGSIIQSLTYDQYDAVGNIKHIQDNLDNLKSETFQYDSLNRLTKATSNMYGGVAMPLNYSYDGNGNLTGKEGITLKYGSQCTTPGKLHAVCGDSAGNIYSYDANGNMITRKGRYLAYDAEDRLKVINDGITDKEKYWYDFSGERTVKKLPDGTVVYNVGMYEIQVAKGETPISATTATVHTKYIYGAQGDLAAQITKDTVTLMALTDNANYTVAQLAGWTNLGAVVFVIRHDINKFFEQTQTPLQLYLFIIFILILMAYVIRNSGNAIRRNPLKVSTAISVLLIFSFTFVFEGCSGTGSNKPPSSADLWSATSSGSTTSVPNLSTPPSVPYDDNWQGGRPITGAYFFHPNHLGSVALVTDKDGLKVSEVHYKPYGERLYKDSSNNPISSGPDIFHYKYTAQEEDPETSLMYYGARYYDPSIGRFITADTIVPGSDSLFKKQNRGNSFNSQSGYRGNLKNSSFNRYMYVGGNPVNYQDPSGHIQWLGFIAGIVLMVAALVIEGVSLGTLSWLAGPLAYAGAQLTVNSYNNCLGTCNFDFGFAYTMQTDYNGNTSSSYGGGSGGGGSGGNGDYTQINSYDYDSPSINLNQNSPLLNTVTWDWNGDGKLQKNEADYWWLHGNGQGISVDASKIDWSGLKIPTDSSVGDKFGISTTDAFLTLRYETAATYGGTSFIVTGNSQVMVLDQLYHYNYRDNSSIENIIRNGMTWIGRPSGQGQDYMIHYYNPVINIK